ncbi:MAG: hypothetical protein JSU08_11315 [Acidobacteria bacterium]|nr:hypothetical protein [Acidobacteriota bacterium]
MPTQVDTDRIAALQAMRASRVAELETIDAASDYGNPRRGLLLADIAALDLGFPTTAGTLEVWDLMKERPGLLDLQRVAG